MTGRILVVSHRKGFEADPVIDGLCNHGVSVFRFNADPEVNGTGISLLMSEDYEIQGFLACDGREVSSQEIKVAWFQQPPAYYNSPATSSENLQRVNFSAALFAFLDILDCEWINYPKRALEFSNKAIQLWAVKKAGFNIPPTLISNSPHQIRNFYKQHNQVVAKNLSTPWLQNNDIAYAAYTCNVEKEWINNDSEISFAPVIYQKFYQRRRDYRVIVIGDKIFAAACNSQNPEQRYDVRLYENMDNEYAPCSLDSEIEQKLLTTLKTLHLDYCSADLIETDDGEILFVDLNTTGSWWWVDKLYKGTICQAFVNLLLKKLNYDSSL